MIRQADRGRVLRECAVDLIRASDRISQEPRPVSVAISVDMLSRVQRDLAQIEASLRIEARRVA